MPYVGWVQRSDTHHCGAGQGLMGIAELNPSYALGGGRYNSRHDRKRMTS